MNEQATATFTRTIHGKVAQYRFFAKPLVWLEGRTDYPMFEPLLSTMDCEVLPAGGKDECLKLAQAMIADDLPYIVVVDGDYEILRRQRSYHRRALMLRRYSIENYSAEPVLLEIVCRRYSEGKAVEGDVGERFEVLLQQIEQDLKALVVVDIAVTKASGGDSDRNGVLSGSIARVLARTVPPAVDRAKVNELVIRDGRDVGREAKEMARTLLSGYTASRRFVDILRGHWVFELIRWFVAGELRRVGMKMNIDNRGLRALLGAEMWRGVISEDHRSLRRGLRRAVTEARRMRAGT